MHFVLNSLQCPYLGSPVCFPQQVGRSSPSQRWWQRFFLFMCWRIVWLSEILYLCERFFFPKSFVALLIFSCCSGWQFLRLMSNHDYHWIIFQLHCTALFQKSSRWLEESFSVLYFDFIEGKRGAPFFNSGHWYCDFQHASVSFWDWSIFGLIPSANACCAHVRSLSCGLYLNLARYYQLFQSVLQLLTVLLAWYKYLGC